MPNEFTRSLGAVLHGLGARASTTAPEQPAARPEPGIADAAARRREWFSRFASERVLPLLHNGAAELENRGCRATVRLGETDGRLVAELQAVPPGLPTGTRPPRLTVTAARPPRLPNAPATRDRVLLVEYTGTFPLVGAGGGFGAEIGYDTVNPSQLEEKLLEFLDLATGA